MTVFNRRQLLVAAAGTIAMPHIGKAAEPEFRLKFGNIVSADHPLNIYMGKARDKIVKESDGRVTIDLFPKNQLGSDADMLSQLRSGALELFAQTGVLMSTLVPVASINGVGFAYPDYGKVWQTYPRFICQSRTGLHGKIVESRFPANHIVHAPDSQARRFPGLQNPCPAIPALDLDVQGLRRIARFHSMGRNLYGHADKNCRRA